MKQPHKEVLNSHKVKLLAKAADAVAEANRNEFSLQIFAGNVSDYSNVQKLRYHGLIHHARSANGTIKRGSWVITRNGYRFLRGDLSLPADVTVQENHIIERSQRLVSCRDVARDLAIPATTFQYITYQSYPEQMRPMAVVASNQLELVL